MKHLFTDFIAAAVFLTAGFIQAQEAGSVQTPAPVSAQASDSAPVEQPTPIDVLFVGDSITDFWDNPGRGLEVYKQYYDGPRRVINIGVSGDVCAQTMARLDQPKVANIKPTMIQLLIGTNNLNRGGETTPAFIVPSIKGILDKLQAKWPEAKIVLLGILPRGIKPDNSYQVRINEINAQLEKMADGKKIIYRDISKEFLKENGELNLDLMPDQLHPNTAGYKVWAKAMEPTFKEILGGNAVKQGAVGSGWWQNRFKQKQELIKQANGQIDLVLLGDSINHNWENQGKAAWEKYYAPRKAIGLGFSGDQTQHVLWRLNNGEMEGYTPKLVVLMIGTNNIGHRNCTPRQTVEGIRAILETLGDKWPETKVLLLAVFPRGADENDPLRKAVNEINEGLPALADGNRVTFMNINDKFLDENKVLSRDIMPDYLHPSKQGHFIWAETIEPFVKQTLGD